MDQSIADLRRQMLETMLEVESRLQALSEAQLARPADYFGLKRNVRFIAHRLGGHALDHTLQVRKTRLALGAPPSEAQGILAQLMHAEAGLLGETIGLSKEDFERAPAEGEWSVRQVLEHTIEIHKRLLKQIEDTLAAEGQG